MSGLDEFLDIFGNVTILNVIEFMMALSCIYFAYKKASDFCISQYELHKLKDEQLKEALKGVKEFSEYRQQNIQNQKLLEDEIKGLRIAQEDITKHLKQIEEQNKRKECNKLRDRLLQGYRYYTNTTSNPTQSWNAMEAEAFWELFKDYEEAGGNGHMHTEVMPAMQRLTVVDIDK